MGEESVEKNFFEEEQSSAVRIFPDYTIDQRDLT